MSDLLAILFCAAGAFYGGWEAGRRRQFDRDERRMKELLEAMGKDRRPADQVVGDVRRILWPASYAAALTVALALTGCDAGIASIPTAHVAANSMTKHHADASHPYAEHPSSQVRAASRDLQEVRDRCEWVDTGSAWLACGPPDDMDERRALEKLDEALAAARRR